MFRLQVIVVNLHIFGFAIHVSHGSFTTNNLKDSSFGSQQLAHSQKLTGGLAGPWPLLGQKRHSAHLPPGWWITCLTVCPRGRRCYADKCVCIHRCQACFRMLDTTCPIARTMCEHVMTISGSVDSRYDMSPSRAVRARVNWPCASECVEIGLLTGSLAVNIMYLPLNIHSCRHLR